MGSRFGMALGVSLPQPPAGSVRNLRCVTTGGFVLSRGVLVGRYTFPLRLLRGGRDRENETYGKPYLPETPKNG